MWTISQFSDRTGLSASTLRFYDDQRLLPAQRLSNGYRAYAPEQVADAQLINSLREAGVGLEAIRRFLAQDRDQRSRMLEDWQQEAAMRLRTILLAQQYLQQLETGAPGIHLQRWEKPSTLLWFPATADPGPFAFRAASAQRLRQLRGHGVRVLEAGFSRTLDWTDGRLVGEVGYRIRPIRRQIPEARRQEVPPTLFATLECSANDEKANHRVFRFLDQLGFQPIGPAFERYLADESESYQLLVALLQESSSAQRLGS